MVTLLYIGDYTTELHGEYDSFVIKKGPCFVLECHQAFEGCPSESTSSCQWFARSKMRRTCIFASWNVALEWWPRCSHGKLLKCSDWVSDDDDGGDDVMVLRIIIMMKMMKLSIMKMIKWNTNIMMIRRKKKTLQFEWHCHMLLEHAFFLHCHYFISTSWSLRWQRYSTSCNGCIWCWDLDSWMQPWSWFSTKRNNLERDKAFPDRCFFFRKFRWTSAIYELRGSKGLWFAEVPRMLYKSWFWTYH